VPFKLDPVTGTQWFGVIPEGDDSGALTKLLVEAEYVLSEYRHRVIVVFAPFRMQQGSHFYRSVTPFDETREDE
jgi:hypothetical protein